MANPFIARRTEVTISESGMERKEIAGRTFIFCPPVTYSHFRGMVMVRVSDLPASLLSQFKPQVVLDGEVPYGELVEWFRVQQEQHHERQKREEEAVEKISKIIEGAKRKGRKPKRASSPKASRSRKAQKRSVR